ncbi:hypothetical protein QBC44DRAFT_118739 [Cladorrhinum sp. PSN332]|nr:hypothetical protein QBC44DRAFT_118739 [Cladorrhinum sp. PSN332]
MKLHLYTSVGIFMLPCLFRAVIADTPEADCLSKTLSLTTYPPSSNLWTLSQFLYQTTNLTSNVGILMPGRFPNPRANILQLTLHNEANNHTQSCSINDTALSTTKAADRWWPCHAQPAPSLYSRTVETYILFNRDAPTLSINQTYFCSNDTGTNNVKITARGSLMYGYTICGDAHSTAYDMLCPGPFLTIGRCNVTYAARWCSLSADRDGFGSPAPVYSLTGADITLLPEGRESEGKQSG